MATRTGGEVSLAGMVVEIIPFRASIDRTGVVKVRDAEKKIRTVIGTIEGLAYGDYVEVAGVERQHPHHGLQVRATTIKASYPKDKETSTEWLIRHLKMDRRKAEGIINDWCEGVTDENISSQISLLWEAASTPVPGLRQDAYTVFDQHDQIAEFNDLVLYATKKVVMDDLVELGLDTKEAFTIFQARGMKAAEEVREDPYVVYYYVETTPFEKVDKIYLRRADTYKTDDRRVRALCMQKVRDFVENGDTAVRYDDLLDLLEEKHDYISARTMIENLHGLEPEMLTFYFTEEQGVLVQPVDLAKYEDGFSQWLVRGTHPESATQRGDEHEF